LLLSVITLLAAWHHIAFDGFTASGDGNDMVHGELARWKISPAIVASSLGQLAFPPLTFPQFPRLISLALETTFFGMKRLEAF